VRLTEHTDYALRTLIYLGVRGDRLTPVGEVAQAYGLSKNHLLKVANQLAAAGYVQTVRGNGGGLRLALPAEAINIGAVVRRMETDMNLVPCFCEGGGCRIETGCVLRATLNVALRAFLAELDRTTLADLVRPSTMLKRLLGLKDPTSPAPSASPG
jgi:Rrf2 family nitric oxide-sensitive transcriptional repressor